MIKDLDAISSSKAPVLASSKRLHPDFWTWVLFAAIIGICFFKAVSFRYSHLIFNYPFISYDGFQWISDSLHYLDSNIEAIHRNPALPLTFAFLRLLGLVDLYPFVIAGLTVSLFLSGYWLMRAFVEPPAARLATLCFFLVFRIHNFFDYILADPWCVVLITLGLSTLLRARQCPRHLIFAAGFFGASLNYQYAAAFASPALIWFLLAGLGFDWLKKNWLIALGGCLVFLGFATPQFIYKWIKFGSPFYSKVVHFELLNPHAYGLFHYFVNFFAFIGWPLAIAVTIGGLSTFRDKKSEFFLMHFYLGCMFIFWVILYLWLDVRFFLYFLPVWFVYLAVGIERLNLISKLSLRSRTNLQRLAIVLFLYSSAFMSSVQFTAFESTVLPLMPGLNLRFSTNEVSDFKVAANTLDDIKLEYEDTRNAFFRFPDFFQFYRRASNRPKHYSDEFFRDLKVITDELKSRTDSTIRVGLCGDLAHIFENKMRIFDTIARNVEVCSEASAYVILLKRDFNQGAMTDQFTPLYQGSELVLLAR